MTMSVRYGIRAFHFLSGNNSGFGFTIISCLLLLVCFQAKKREFLFYFILAFISLILTTKGVIYSFITFSVIIYLITDKGSIKTKHILILTIGLLLISSFQIKSYFMDQTSVRMVFLVSSYSIANDYYPLGSGFATFGGEQAKIHYSPLYKKYGFNQIWGLSKKDNMFLNDNYLAMILGQTGYFGMLLYFIIIYRIFQSINKCLEISKGLKIFSIAVLLMLYISSIATGIIKTTNGVFLFSLLAVLLPKNNNFKVYDS